MRAGPYSGKGIVVNISPRIRSLQSVKQDVAKKTKISDLTTAGPSLEMFLNFCLATVVSRKVYQVATMIKSKILPAAYEYKPTANRQTPSQSSQMRIVSIRFP